MFSKEILLRFTWADVGKAICISPVAVVIAYGIICLPWESVNAPAWVQAVGSILALIGAAYLPIVHSRHVEQRREEMTLGQLRFLAEDCYEKLWMLTNIFLDLERESDQIASYLRFGRDEEWGALEQAVARFPLELVPASRLTTIAHLNTTIATAIAVCKQLETWRTQGSHPEMMELLRVRRELLGALKSKLPWPDGLPELRPVDRHHQSTGARAEVQNPPAMAMDRLGDKVWITLCGKGSVPSHAIVQIVFEDESIPRARFVVDPVHYEEWVDGVSARAIAWRLAQSAIFEAQKQAM